MSNDDGVFGFHVFFIVENMWHKAHTCVVHVCIHNYYNVSAMYAHVNS